MSLQKNGANSINNLFIGTQKITLQAISGLELKKKHGNDGLSTRHTL